MNFPKNHMLSKYCENIRQKGVIHKYSTTQIENQHTFDTKKPARKSISSRILLNRLVVIVIVFGNKLLNFN